MVYSCGKQDHTIDSGEMINHIVRLVEQRVAEIESQKAMGKNH